MLLLLLCLSAVVGGHGDGESSAAMVKAMLVKQEEQEVAVKLMREQMARQEQQTAELKGEIEQKDQAMQQQAIAALTDARKAKTEHAHVQLTTGGEVVELVSAAYVKALVEQMEACARRNGAQDAEIGAMREELKSGRAPCGERGDQRWHWSWMRPRPSSPRRRPGPASSARRSPPSCWHA